MRRGTTTKMMTASTSCGRENELSECSTTATLYNDDRRYSGFIIHIAAFAYCANLSTDAISNHDVDSIVGEVDEITSAVPTLTPNPDPSPSTVNPPPNRPIARPIIKS